jgi:hypothetical protein
VVFAVRQAARRSKTVRFTALLHHITTDLLKRSYLALARDAAPGTDGVTWPEEKLKDLRLGRVNPRLRLSKRLRRLPVVIKSKNTGLRGGAGKGCA